MADGFSEDLNDFLNRTVMNDLKKVMHEVERLAIANMAWRDLIPKVMSLAWLCSPYEGGREPLDEEIYMAENRPFREFRVKYLMDGDNEINCPEETKHRIKIKINSFEQEKIILMEHNAKLEHVWDSIRNL